MIYKIRLEKAMPASIITKFICSRWLYPALLTILLLVLSVLHISGSSLGIYSQIASGVLNNKSILANNPQPVRSDEWLVTTQLTISQSKLGYPAFNPEFNGGRDVSLITDVPYANWSEFFKPQNLIFFITPFSFAFAFKWWLLIYLLLISSYFFILKATPRHKAIAIFGSILISFSPFVFWWYQTITIAPLFYGFFILIVGMDIINDRKYVSAKTNTQRWVLRSLRILLLTYLLISFTLVLYPPFQIPVAISVLLFLVGVLLNKLSKGNNKQLLLPLLSFAVVIILSTGIGMLFIMTRHNAIESIESTAYPGKRSVESGGISPSRILTTYLQPLLQDSHVDNSYLENKSEASNFILLPFFFLLPSIGLVIWLRLKYRRYDWVLILMIFGIILFSLHMFVPAASPFTKLFLLYLVPTARTLIGLGFITILLISYAVNVLLTEGIVFKRRYIYFVFLYAILFFLIYIKEGLVTKVEYPNFVSSTKLIFVLASIITIGSTLLLLRKYTIGLAILAIFSIYSVYRVQPLYNGVSAFSNNVIIRDIQDVSSKKDVWATNSLLFENFPQMGDRPSVSGVSFYPNNTFWHTYFPNVNSNVYNRYAHIYINYNKGSSIQLVQPDTFTVSATCNEPFTHQIDFVLSTVLVNMSCYKLIKTQVFSNIDIYFYKIM